MDSKENIIDKVGIESPPAVHPDMQHLIIDHGYWFSSIGYPTHQTLPVTPFYLFNIDIEQRDIMIATDKDLVCKGVHSQQYFQSFYVNSTVDLTFGDLVCFDRNTSLVKSDFTIHALPVGIYYQNGLHEGQAKVLMRGSIGVCRLIGGCIVNDELGMSSTANSQGLCQKNGIHVFAIAMENIIDTGLVSLVKVLLL